MVIVLKLSAFCNTFSIILMKAADAVNYIQTFISQRCQVDLPMTKTFCLTLLLSSITLFWVWLPCPCFVTSFHEKRDTLDLLGVSVLASEVGPQRLCLVCDSFMAAQLLRWPLAPQAWYLQGVIPNIIKDLLKNKRIHHYSRLEFTSLLWDSKCNGSCLICNSLLEKIRTVLSIFVSSICCVF